MVFPDMIRHRCLERGALVVVDPNTMREGNPLPYVPCGGHGGGFFFWPKFRTSRGLPVLGLEICKSCGLSGKESDVLDTT
jgi:hypothetical protein